MNLQFMKRSHACDVGRAATCTEVRNSNPAGESNSFAHSLKGFFSGISYRTIAICLAVMSVVHLYSQSLIYVGSTPSDGSTVGSITDIELEFDLSDVIANFGDQNWGICPNGFQNQWVPQLEKTAKLYEGNSDSGILLETVSTALAPNSEGFKVGNTCVFKFSGFETKPNQLYTLVITYEFFAGIEGNSTWNTSTILSFKDNPLILTFYGASETTRVLKYEGSNINENQKYEKLSKVQLSFNYDIALNDVSQTSSSILENGEVLEVSQSICVDPEDAKSLIISFPETTLYNNHNYTISVPEGVVSIADDQEIVNSAISIPIVGDGCKGLELGRTTPSKGGESTLDEVIVSFKFPEGYGFGWGNINCPLQIFKGNDINGEILQTLDASVGSGTTSLVYAPTFDVEAGQEYTLYIAGGRFKVYEPGTMKYIEDYVIDPVTITCSTPSLEDLPEYVFTECIYADGQEVEYVGNVDWLGNTYTYNDVAYNSSKVSTDKTGVLYKIVDGERVFVKDVTLRKTRNTDDILVLRAEVESYLDKGFEYEVVIPEGTMTVTVSNFLKKNLRNQETSVRLVGKHSMECIVTIIGSDGHATKTIVPRNQDVVLEFAPAEDWVIEGVSHDETPIELDADNRYTIPAIDKDAVISVAHAYNGTLELFDITTDVAEYIVEGAGYVVAREDGMIRISKLKAGEDTVSVYSVGGQLISSPKTAAGDVMKIAVNPGVYIVRVNDIAFKVRV